MNGYGQIPPQANWPDKAVIAVQFVVNYEEGGENCLLHGDDSSESFLSEIVNCLPWPNKRHKNMESLYEYGARAGFWRIHALFTQHEIPVTIFGVATALKRSPAQVEAMQKANWEIASHGLKWIDYKDHSVEAELADIKAAIKLHEAITGQSPQGWYTGRCSVNTVDIITKLGGFDYVSDSYADDLPYWHHHKERDQLIIPYTLDANDMRFATAQGFNSGDQFYNYLKDSFDVLYAEGVAGFPKMLNIGLHCRIIGRPGRIAALQRFIDYVKSHQHVWFARRIDIAHHWREHHPPPSRSNLPSMLDRETFIKNFGNIFEHSEWIAERAYDEGLGSAHDTRTGLFSALALQFRLATQDQKLAVLKSHPDLAGKLALSKQLTKASTNEQAGAGLDNLTPQEHTQFTKLNNNYTEKFGFPFIIAVKGLDKSRILEAFEQRLTNQRDVEFSTACLEVERIANFRIQALLA